jgi:hypothetical protein
VHLPFSVIFLYEIETYRSKDCCVLLQLHVTVKGTVSVAVTCLLAGRLTAKDMYNFLKNEYLFIFAYKIDWSFCISSPGT